MPYPVFASALAMVLNFSLTSYYVHQDITTYVRTYVLSRYILYELS